MLSAGYLTYIRICVYIVEELVYEREHGGKYKTGNNTTNWN